MVDVRVVVGPRMGLRTVVVARKSGLRVLVWEMPISKCSFLRLF